MTTATTSRTELPVPVRDGPHWRVVIHPAESEYQAERIPSLGECWRIVERTRDARFGWEYPIVRMDGRCGQGADWIASWWSVDEESQYWRLYQSGQFVHLLSFWEDRQNAREAIKAEYSKWSPPTPLPACSTGYLSFREAIQRLTAIFGFASRLMVAGALGGAPVLRIEMKQIKDRHLVFYGYPFGFAEPRDYRAHEDLGREWRLALGDDPLERAREAAHWFFERFSRPGTSETALKLAQEDFLNNRWR